MLDLILTNKTDFFANPNILASEIELSLLHGVRMRYRSENNQSFPPSCRKNRFKPTSLHKERGDEPKMLIAPQVETQCRIRLTEASLYFCTETDLSMCFLIRASYASCTPLHPFLHKAVTYSTPECSTNRVNFSFRLVSSSRFGRHGQVLKKTLRIIVQRSSTVKPHSWTSLTSSGWLR
jgi:hypothetical protein